MENEDVKCINESLENINSSLNSIVTNLNSANDTVDRMLLKFDSLDDKLDCINSLIDERKREKWWKIW